MLSSSKTNLKRSKRLSIETCEMISRIFYIFVTMHEISFETQKTWPFSEILVLVFILLFSILIQALAHKPTYTSS